MHTFKDLRTAPITEVHVLLFPFVTIGALQSSLSNNLHFCNEEKEGSVGEGKCTPSPKSDWDRWGQDQQH